MYSILLSPREMNNTAQILQITKHFINQYQLYHPHAAVSLTSVFSFLFKTTKDPLVLASAGSFFHHEGARTESLDACF